MSEIDCVNDIVLKHYSVTGMSNSIEDIAILTITVFRKIPVA